MFFPRLSFRWKAIFGIALIEALTLSITIIGALGQMERSQAELIERSANTATSLFSAAVSDAMLSSDLAKIDAVSQDLVSRNEAVFVKVLDQDGRLVVERGDAAALQRTFDKDQDPLDDLHGVFAVSAPILAGKERIGEIRLGIDNRQARVEISHAKQLAAVIAAIGMSLAALFSWLLGGWVAAGIQRLSDGARRIEAGVLDARVDEQGEAELSSLARTFNSMAGSLQARESEREALLARAEQAVTDAHEASRAKSAFLAAMSHEIRTPLNGVVGLAGILADNQQPEMARDYSRQLGVAANQLRMIVNDILDFSKIEAGKLDLEDCSFAVEDILATCRASFASLAMDKGLALDITLDPALPRTLRGDPTRLTQILSNYVSNALKFTARGRVDARIELLGRAGPKVNVRLSVRDTGRGVSRAEVDALFEPFVQADASIVRSHGGTGLGLTICKRLAEAMGGSVGGEGEIGRGALFWADVWLGEGDPAELATRRDSVVATRPLTDLNVLVVDDIAINRTVACHLVSRAGARTEQADNGVRALERISAGGIDLVLMDIQMPVMDGKTATREIIAKFGAGAPPIVGLTAHAISEERDDCLALGMCAYLTKPIDTRALLAVLEQVAAAGDRASAPSVPPAPVMLEDLSTPVLDLSRVDAQLDGDFDLYREVLGGSLPEIAQMHADLLGMAGNPEADVLTLVHSIKGACLNLCFVRASDQARTLERSLRDGTLAAADRASAVVSLADFLAEAESAARRYLAEGSVT
jgi:signal transduction histidine kinase/ActR/RegA family two-component response regulator/HPt (histidine-containing phosphotransfer) domain-containing protein